MQRGSGRRHGAAARNSCRADRAAAGGLRSARRSSLGPIPRRSITGDGVRQTLAASASGSRSRCTRCRPAPRSSTGPCRASGTSGEAWIKDPRGRTVVDFQRPRTCTSSATACRFTARLPLAELRRAPLHPAGAARRSSPTAPPTTRRPGASACRTASWSRCRRASTRSASTRRWRTGALTYGERVPARRDGRARS